MKLGEVSEIQLALVIAVATALGGAASSFAESLWIDAGTEKEANVQLVQLAIGILSEPIIEKPTREFSINGLDLISYKVPTITSQKALRSWAVDTINNVAEVNFSEETKTILVNGDAAFSIGLSSKFTEIIQGLNDSKPYAGDPSEEDSTDSNIQSDP